MKKAKKTNDINNNAVEKPKKTNARYHRIAQRKKQREEYLNSDEYKVLQIAKEQKTVKQWYKLDNAALLYPMSNFTESDCVFRLAVQLKEDVEPILLQQAINAVYMRFPTMTGTLRNGVFLPYVDKPTLPLIALKDTNSPCTPMQMNGKYSQVRVMYNKRELICEFLHSATDGSGGIAFLNCLLHAYFDLQGKPVTTKGLHYLDKPNNQELTDRFSSVAVKKNPPPLPKPVKVSKMVGTALPTKIVMTRRGIMDSTQLYNVAKQHNATITEFLGAIILLSIDNHNQLLNNHSTHPIRLEVPVNLRKQFKMDTLRNFSSYIFYQYNGQNDVQQIVSDIKQQTSEQLTENYFRGMVSYNYNSAQQPAVKFAPFVLKSLVLRVILTRLGEGVINNGIISNLGVINAPEEFKNYIDRYDFQLGKGHKKNINFAVATFNNKCVITVTSGIKESNIEQHFFSTLASLGVDIAIEADNVEGIE